MKVAIPGVGGNLGECVVCGSAFLMEIMLGQKVMMVEVDGIAAKLPIHQKCKPHLEAARDAGEGGWRMLPEGPLRSEFQRVYSEANHDQA